MENGKGETADVTLKLDDLISKEENPLHVNIAKILKSNFQNLLLIQTRKMQSKIWIAVEVNHCMPIAGLWKFQFK